MGEDRTCQHRISKCMKVLVDKGMLGGIMPHTIQYRPVIIDQLISNNRIDSYQSVFNPSNDIELMGVYLWNAHVASALFPLLSSSEITLRNSIDYSLRQHLGNYWWSANKLHYRSYSPGVNPPQVVKNLRNNFKRASEKHIREHKSRYNVQGNVTPRHQDIVAKTEFSTWEFILDDEFMGNGLIWPSRLGTVFRGPWPSQKAGLTLNRAKDLVSTVRDFRNRLFHHEPAWKKFGIVNETDAITHLQEKIAVVEDLINLVNPEKINLLNKNGIISNAKRTCSSAEIRRFQHIALIHNVKSISKLGDMLGSVTKNNEPALMKFYNGSKQKFLITPI